MRQIEAAQIPLVAALFVKAGIQLDVASLEVVNLDDGGMGSVRFSTAVDASRFGDNVAEITFNDTDGVHVSVALYIDQYGNPFELDVFKADFSRLNAWPTALDLNEEL